MGLPEKSHFPHRLEGKSKILSSKWQGILSLERYIVIIVKKADNDGQLSNDKNLKATKIHLNDKTIYQKLDCNCIKNGTQGVAQISLKNAKILGSKKKADAP